MSRPFTSLSINIVFQFYHKSEHFFETKEKGRAYALDLNLISFLLSKFQVFQ